VQLPAFDLEQARRGGKGIYHLKFDLIHDIQRQGKTPLEVLKRLIESGTILDTSFDLASAGTLEDEPSNTLLFEVVYATGLDEHEIGRIFDASPERVRVIERNGEKSPAPSSAEALLLSRSASQASSNSQAPPDPVPAPAPETARAVQAQQVPAAETTIRLNVALLDSLMTLAGELVLSRNQLNEAVAHKDERGIGMGAHRLSMVTSELQEAVSLTRMQPVGSLFSKFPRLVRDLAQGLGKDVQLQIEGGDVELDKTILEGLSDPLTHMVRNSVDHGIETPRERSAAGKPATGTVTLRARHQAGQVVIEVADDGKGLSGARIAASALAKGLIGSEQLQSMPERDKIALVFLPGVSTAETVSDVSGRGVGMDVVKTNLDRLGGKIEIDSVPGRGSSFRIKLPLTLAIIPSLLVSDGGERFAIPQVSVGELIRIPASQIAGRIDRAGDAEVLLLRDRLVPLLHLAGVLGKPRQDSGANAMNVVLVDAGLFEYGLVVEELHDTVEIVVKPLGRHFQGLADYAGATILGDGQVALILDVSGLAARGGLTGTGAAAAEPQTAEDGAAGEIHSLLLFHNAPDEPCAVPIEIVTRIERVRPSQVQMLGGRRTMQYGGASLPLVVLHDVASTGELAESQQWLVIVFERAGRPLGLLAAAPIDMVEMRLALDTVTLRQPGVAGSAVIKDRATLLLDIFELAETVRRGWPEPGDAKAEKGPGRGDGATVLIAEDSDFFRGQIKRIIEAVGYKVLAAADGEAAWDLLDHHAGEVAVLATDIEMPRLDGLGLTKRIRADSRFSRLPVIALSSLAAEEEIARGMAVGVTEYQVKLDQDRLVECIRKAVGGKPNDPTASQPAWEE
jgi:two-component system chemotaxis sensor kinase CheA